MGSGDTSFLSSSHSGVKFVIKQQPGVRKQFLIVDNEVLMVFVKKKKKFTQCEAFSDISSSVKCKVREEKGRLNLNEDVSRLSLDWPQLTCQSLRALTPPPVT